MPSTDGTSVSIVTIHRSQVIASVKERTDEKFVPESYISGNFLTRCFERRGGESAGFIAGFQDQYAIFGRKKVSS